MYNNKNVLSKNNEGKSIIKRLFTKIKLNPKKLLIKTNLIKINIELFQILYQE